MRRQAVIVCTSSVALAAVLLSVLQACGADSIGSPHASRPPATDIQMTAADFRNVHTMTKVRGFFVYNRLGHLAAAVRVASSLRGGTYPVGTILQLVPQEAMVKRRKGFDPSTNDWEFFFLDTSTRGTRILKRGTDDVVNRFGGNCASCHRAAAAQFDMVCEHSHGCAPLPISDAVIAAIQGADPRPIARTG